MGTLTLGYMTGTEYCRFNILVDRTTNKDRKIVLEDGEVSVWMDVWMGAGYTRTLILRTTDTDLVCSVRAFWHSDCMDVGTFAPMIDRLIELGVELEGAIVVERFWREVEAEKVEQERRSQAAEDGVLSERPWTADEQAYADRAEYAFEE